MALLVMVSVPLSKPVDVGTKATLMVQLAPAASEAEQLLVCVKLAVTAMPLIVAAEPPVLETVTNCVPLVVPTG